MIQGGDGAVAWVFCAVKLRQYAHPERRCRFWKRVRLRLGARDHEDGFLMQIDVHIPLAVLVVIVVEADDHAWQLQMTGLVVVVVGGVGFWVRDVAEANEGKKVVGCEGASRPPRRSRHNRHACQLRPLECEGLLFEGISKFRLELFGIPTGDFAQKAVFLGPRKCRLWQKVPIRNPNFKGGF